MFKQSIVAPSVTSLFIIFIVSACGGSSPDPAGDTPSFSSVASTRTVAPGIECPNGGIQVDSGIDENANGVLDDSEIDTSEIICNGEDGSNGLNSLIAITDEPAGTNCEFGGSLIETGIDNNGDSILQDTEVTDAEYICLFSESASDGLVYVADSNFPSMQEIFKTNDDGSATSKIFGAESAFGDVFDFQISPDKTKVAFRADNGGGGLDKIKLYVASLLTGLPAYQVSVTNEASSFGVPAYKWSPDSSRLAYASDPVTPNLYELITVLADGTGNISVSAPNPTRLGLFSFTSFEWSPDSQQLAYMADEGALGVFELYTTTFDGRIRTKVSHDISGGGNILSGFQWSPDGSRLAYRGDTGDAIDKLFTVLPDGTDLLNVSFPLVSGGEVLSFKWAPDGSHIAYRADKVIDQKTELFTIAPDGTGVVKVSGVLISGGSVTPDYEWSADSSHLAYLAEKEIGGRIELFSVLADGTGSTKVSLLTVSNGQITHFKWSPDSLSLAYRGDVDEDDVFALFTASRDGTNNTQVSGSLQIGGDVLRKFEWSPDSNQLAYLALNATQDELYTAFSDGSSSRKVSGLLLIASLNVGDFSWSPDNLHLAYRVDDSFSDAFELNTVLADGTGLNKIYTANGLFSDEAFFAWY